MTYVNQTHQ